MIKHIKTISCGAKLDVIQGAELPASIIIVDNTYESTGTTFHNSAGQHKA